MIKKIYAVLLALNLVFVPFVNAQTQQNSSSSASSSASGGAGASSAAGAATAGVTAGVVGAAVAAVAVAAAISSSKADPVYTYSNTGQSWGTVTICVANC